jgi:vanillate O-demethylase monooxygenase subunit
MFPRTLVRRLHARRDRRTAARAHGLQREDRFYRGDGQVAAWRTSARTAAPQLSLGTVCEGKLVCGYHGLVMGCDGKTVPCRASACAASRRSAYPVVERYGFVWVWPGDAALADAAKIHHLEWAENPEWAYGGGLYHIACDYRLMVDNLMDLTHETYVHATSIGQKEIDETPVTTKTEGDHVVTSRFMNNVMAPPFWRANLRGNTWPTTCRWTAGRSATSRRPATS